MCTVQVLVMIENLVNHCLLLNWILDFVEVDWVFISQKVENIERFDGLGSVLLVPENEINPLVELCGDNVGFKGQAVNTNEILRCLKQGQPVFYGAIQYFYSGSVKKV